MTAYLATAVGVIFLTVAVSFVVPDGKLNKSVNFIMRLVCIAVLFQPITKIFKLSDEETESYTDYSLICETYAYGQSRALEDKIYEELEKNCDCSVLVSYSDGEMKEEGVTVYGNFENDEEIEKVREYLEALGYINITVNDQGD